MQKGFGWNQKGSFTYFSVLEIRTLLANTLVCVYRELTSCFTNYSNKAVCDFLNFQRNFVLKCDFSSCFEYFKFLLQHTVCQTLGISMILPQNRER